MQMNRLAWRLPQALMRSTLCLLLAAAAWVPSTGAWAQGVVWSLPTREGVHTSVYWEAAPQAWATVLLFPGGTGGLGKIVDGRPSNPNFLVHSVQDFLAQGLNVAVFGRPDGHPLSPLDRMGSAHMQDIRAVLQAVSAQSSLPIWLVGTSRGTTSVASAASRLGDAGFAGVVMTSSIVAPQEPGSLPSLNLSAVDVPVLLIQNARDACRLCTPSAMPGVFERFTHAPVKRLRLVEGGGPPSGGVCRPTHWHGFVGMQREVVQKIAQWIRQPQP